MKKKHITGTYHLPAPNEPTIYLLDDDLAVRQSVASIARSLEMPLEILGKPDDFLQLLKTSNSTPPGCLVVDIRLPGMSGLDLLEKLHEEKIFFTAIVVAADPKIHTVVRAMRAGALHFFEKPFEEEQLWNSIQEALHRDAEHRRRQFQMERIRRRMEKLTEGESKVLALLLEGKKNREIAESIKVAVRTVEERRKRILEKMKVSSMAELIREVVLLELLSAS